MPGGVRLGDLAKGIDAHGCKVCPHTVIGPSVQGSPNVKTNGKPAVRKGDGGIHMLCCGSNKWHAAGGSGTVSIIGNSQATGFKKAAKNGAPFVCNCSK